MITETPRQPKLTPLHSDILKTKNCQNRICVVTDQIRFWQFLFWVYLNLMYFDLNCDAECDGVNVGCLGVSVIDVI